MNIFKLKKQINQFTLYLPIGFVRIIKSLKLKIPNTSFLLSDFSSLPSLDYNSNLYEINKPIISRKLKDSWESKDFECVLEPEFGTTDVFFPTDFELISKLLENEDYGKQKVLSSIEFFTQNAHEKWAQTRSGYNPMLEHFANTSFLIKN